MSSGGGGGSKPRETSAARLIRGYAPHPFGAAIGSADAVLSAKRMVPTTSKAPVGPAQRPWAGPADGASPDAPATMPSYIFTARTRAKSTWFSR